ncbi:IS110 family RNA-guided transposase [Paenibacillus albus]|uniref:IS110 family transposase n=1 Tax=Paenibacillus albus TaxID=2495582 RepID=A0A3Q8X557_9BACL|nr:IS110 family transposase [Paenibacillus albus]AZN39913.1 IS110 family transposase [Paenibacillus albus]AZN41535.1 IS110 family transposase [Paenibacillus albus]AZN42675.1 IS110 family transposase [Paenibacillus albus]
MKFKAQDKQNQLIEKITAQHIVVGIDIAQQIHVARAVNFRGIALGNPLPFSNDEEGFQSLLQWIHSIQVAHSLTATIVGMEPTGHYWLNVSNWLSERQFEVVLVNPHLVKKNKENRDNTPSKSDKKDALVIADMVKNGYYSFIRNTPEAFEELRVFLSNRDSVVTRLVSAKNQIHRWVDVVFPELRQVFKSLMCTGSLATLRLFPMPEELSMLQPHDVITGWKTLMKRHSGERKARVLISLACRSVGSKQATHAYKLHLKQLLDEYDLACQQLKTVEAEILTVLDRIPFAKSMLAVKGISAISLAGILGEAGDLSGFVHGNALLRHAGLNLAEASSGKWTGQMKISKRGRSRLRRFIFMMTMSLVMNNPEFQALHAHNVQVKKMKKMRSIMKLCGKLARILVGMARSREAYNPQKTMPFQLAA